jgi:hypothetical protein
MELVLESDSRTRTLIYLKIPTMKSNQTSISTWAFIPANSLLWKPKLLLLAAACLLLGIRAANATGYTATILADKPAAYYEMQETTGAGTAADSSGNGYNGAIAYDYDLNDNIDYPVLGKDGVDTNAYLFYTYSDTNAENHVSDIDVPANGVLNPSGPFSIEFWARAISDAGNYVTPVGSVSGSYPQPGYDFYQTPGAEGNWVLNVPTASVFMQSASPVAKNQWTHLVGVYDGANFSFYINGVAIGTAPGTGFQPSTADFYIGGVPPSGWGSFDGYLTQVAIYTNALTSAQVLTHYEAGTNSFSTNAEPPEVLAGLGATTADPASVTNDVGNIATFDPIVAGATPLTYEWFTNGVADPAATNLVLSFASTSAENGSSYYLVVTNNYGKATSEVATLTVISSIIINSGPQSITRNVGSYAAFHVTASGTAPLGYVWSVSSNGGTTFTPIAGATNETLWLSNVQLTQNNNQYSVFVTGPDVSSNVAPATLLVQARPVNVPLTGYGAIIAADKPVALWLLNEPFGSTTAIDAVGSFNGTYTLGAVGGFNFDVPTGVPASTDPVVGLTNGVNAADGASIQIPFAPELNPDTAWSVETWIQPHSLGLNGNDYRVVLSSQYNLYPNPYNGWYLYQEPSGVLAFVPQPGNGFLTAGTVAVGNWYHLVITDDGTNFNFYINGVLATAPYSLASADFIPNGDGINPNGSAAIGAGLGNTVMGQRSDGAFNSFDGAMGDTAIYNYALTPQQVQLHFLGTVHLTISQSGNKVILSWPTGTLQQSTSVTGPYSNVSSATSPYTNTISGAQGFYRVQVQ